MYACKHMWIRMCVCLYNIHIQHQMSRNKILSALRISLNINYSLIFFFILPLTLSFSLVNESLYVICNFSFSSCNPSKLLTLCKCGFPFVSSFSFLFFIFYQTKTIEWCFLCIEEICIFLSSLEIIFKWRSTM